MVTFFFFYPVAETGFHTFSKSVLTPVVQKRNALPLSPKKTRRLLNNILLVLSGKKHVQGTGNKLAQI